MKLAQLKNNTEKAKVWFNKYDLSKYNNSKVNSHSIVLDFPKFINTHILFIENATSTSQALSYFNRIVEARTYILNNLKNGSIK